MAATTKTQRDAKTSSTLPPGSRVGIIAGSGNLPVQVAEALLERGERPFALIIDGEAGARGALARIEHVGNAIDDPGSAISRLKAAGVTHIVLAGGVGRRPSLLRMRWTPALVKIAFQVFRNLAKGDDRLLRTIVNLFERNGFKVIGAHEIVPDLLAGEGPLGKHRPRAADRRDIEAACEAAKAIGRLDIGQAAISIGGRVVALEGIEGTDGLLHRTAGLRNHGRLAGKKGGVLVKCSKPGQEVRADLPAIGPATVEGAASAGLAGIAVEAGRSLVLDFEETIARADSAGLFVVGVPPEGDA